MIYRIMYNTNSMNADTDYIEMAQLLGDAALPGEAAAVLDKAMSTGVHQGRAQGAHHAPARPVEDPCGCRQEGSAAGRRRGGQESRRASSTSSSARCTTASATIKRPRMPSIQGSRRAKIKHLDEAYVYLGLADAQLKNYADAKKAFANLKTRAEHQPARAEAVGAVRRQARLHERQG